MEVFICSIILLFITVFLTVVFKISCERLLVCQLVSLVGKAATFPPGQAGYTTDMLSVSETFHPEA